MGAPTLMGFGNDPDKLVLISDGDPNGAQVVAFWRDKIPVAALVIMGAENETRKISDISHKILIIIDL